VSCSVMAYGVMRCWLDVLTVLGSVEGLNACQSWKVDRSTKIPTDWSILVSQLDWEERCGEAGLLFSDTWLSDY
jgi:hypothetical protein